MDTLAAVRKQYHRHLQMNVNSVCVDPTIAGNPENMRAGVDRVLGYAGLRAGMPAPSCCGIRVVDSGPAISLALDNEDAFFDASLSEDAADAEMRLLLVPKLTPTKIFGMEQAVTWVQLAVYPPHRELLERANRALGDESGLALARIIYRLAEERVPVSATELILTAIARCKVDAGSDHALSQVTEEVRTALSEISARHYLSYFHVQRGFRAGADLIEGLKGSDVRSAEQAIIRTAERPTAAFLIFVDDAADRRRVWEVTEALFAKTAQLNRPAIVIKQAEIPDNVGLPGLSRLVPLKELENI